MSVDGLRSGYIAPWYLADILGEVMDLAKKLGASFHHIKRSANALVDCLPKEGIQHPI